MINELGNSKSNMELHEDYKLIENSDYIGLIYSSKYRVQKILLNISDKYTFICKVDIQRNDKLFIIVIVYAHLMSLMKYLIIILLQYQKQSNLDLLILQLFVLMT